MEREDVILVVLILFLEVLSDDGRGPAHHVVLVLVDLTHHCTHLTIIIFL